MIRPGEGGDRRLSREVVDRLYEEARALEPGARTAFVGAATRGAPSLRDEVLSLLEGSEAAEEFFERLSKTMPAPAIESSGVALSTGQAVGHYRILEPIGAGGMGIVYRAHDNRLDRDVALKFLPSHLTTCPGAQDRLLLEARAVAAVEHPNICTVYEIGESQDGRPFIAMALCHGETLKERLARGPLPVREAVGIAVQIARGLAAAHARGIVHRDVKPGNVILTGDGTVKLLDFGLAEMASPDVTRSGPGPGTVAYMSPEQARGRGLDQRTDLWSLGIILYEMLSGARPFRGGSDQALLEAILHQSPEPVSKLRPETTDGLARVVNRLLETEPERRYGSARELLTDLERIGSPTVSDVAPRIRRRPTASRRVALGTAGALIVIALFLGKSWILDSDPVLPLAEATDAAPAIAVLPFSVHGAGLEIWREGMVALLSTALDGAGGLRAIDSRTVLARWSEEIGDGRADLPHALGVARGTHARYALVGSVVVAGPRLRMAAELYDLESGRTMGNAMAEGSPDSILSLVDRLGTEALRVVFEEAPGGLPTIDLARVTTGSLPALKAYLDGEVHFRRSDFLGAIDAWERAVAADTLFALAYYWLGEAYGWDEGGNPARYFEMLDRAHRLADRLPARERSLVRARRLRQWSHEAIAVLEGLVREYPDDAEAWYELGEGYYHNSGNMRGPDEAERAFRRAAGLQPSSGPLRAHLLDLAFGWRPDSARIATELDDYGRVASRSRRAVAGRVAFELAFGGPNARSLARAALDTLDSEAAGLTYSFLRHPRFVAERETVYGAVNARLQRESDLPMWWRLMDLGAGTGRVREALGSLDHPLMPPHVRGCGPLQLSILGLPVPDAILDAELSTRRADSSGFRNPSWVMCAAKYAAGRGQLGDHERLLSHARDMAGAALAGGDTVSAQRWDRTVLEAEAHALWRQGRKADALAGFQSLLASHVDAEWALWYVGQLASELGRLDLAERAYERLWLEPLASRNLGRIYERTNRPVEARQAYEVFVLAWRDADPELQPLVQEARRAITRLGRAKE